MSRHVVVTKKCPMNGQVMNRLYLMDLHKLRTVFGNMHMVTLTSKKQCVFLAGVWT